MNIEQEEKEGTMTLKIDGALSIYQAGILRDRLLSCFQKYNGLTLALDQVDDCDLSGIQLLCSARNTAINAQKSFEIRNPSESVLKILNDTGFSQEEIVHTQSKKRITKHKGNKEKKDG